MSSTFLGPEIVLVARTERKIIIIIIMMNPSKKSCQVLESMLHLEVLQEILLILPQRSLLRLEP